MSSARGHTDGGDQGQARRVSPRDLVPGHLCVAAFRIPSFSEMFIGVLTDPGPATRVLVSMSHAQLTLLGPLNPRDLPSRTTFSQPSTYLSDKPACGQPISHSYRLPCSGTETGFCPPPPRPRTSFLEPKLCSARPLLLAVERDRSELRRWAPLRAALLLGVQGRTLGSWLLVSERVTLGHVAWHVDIPKMATVSPTRTFFSQCDPNTATMEPVSLPSDLGRP